MTIRYALFLGGPADGQIRAIDRARHFFEVMGFSHLKPVSLKAIEETFNVTTEVYIKTGIESDDTAVYTWKGLDPFANPKSDSPAPYPIIFDHLIKGYRVPLHAEYR